MKRAVESLLLHSGALRRAALRSGHGRIVLAFHNVVPDAEAGAGDASLHMAQSRFADLVGTLQRIGRCVPMAAALDALRAGRSATGLEFVITFDDAYQGAVTGGLEVTRALGVPVTIFVAPALLGVRATWWDAAAQGGAIPAAQRDAWLDGPTAGRGARIQAAGTAAPDVPASYAIASEAALRALAADPLVTVASHSWSHASLSALADHDPAQLQHELHAPLAWLREHMPRTVAPWLAYPYGRVNAAAMAAAAAAGYEAAFRVDGGALHPDQPPMALARINVPAGMRAAGILLRATGWRG